MLILSRFIKFATYLLITLIFTACSPRNQEILLDQINPKQMAQLTLKLDEIGIVTKITKNNNGTYTISVPKKDFNDSNRAILNLGIYDKNNTDDQIMKVISKSSIVETPQEQQFKFNQILSLQLSSTISTLDHVISANVYISNVVTSNADNVDLMQDSNPNNILKASVYVKVSGLPFDSRAALINNVKKIVAGAVVGLDINSIYVVIEDA